MKSESHYDLDNIDELIADKDKFDAFVYTPVTEAIKEIERRRKDKKLSATVHELLGGDIIEPITGPQIRAVIFRQIATPNYEIRRFLHAMGALDELVPLFGEFRDDKFTTNNDQKHSWGKILFHKTHNAPFHHATILDLRSSDGKKISEAKTFWGQSLVEFHHELFQATYMPTNPDYFFDISPWLQRHGGTANFYYKKVMLWFIQNAILFENFMPGETKEAKFTKEVFLPAFIEVYKRTGFKPLIVNLLPTSIENEKFWFSHPFETKQYIEQKMKQNV